MVNTNNNSTFIIKEIASLWMDNRRDNISYLAFYCVENIVIVGKDNAVRVVFCIVMMTGVSECHGTSGHVVCGSLILQ